MEKIMAMSNSNNPTSPRGDGWGSHNDEVEKGAKSREVLAETATESPLAFDGTTVEKALQTTAKVADVSEKDEGERASAEASAGKIEAAKELNKEEDKSSDSKSSSSAK